MELWFTIFDIGRELLSIEVLNFDLDLVIYNLSRFLFINELGFGCEEI